MDHFYTRTKELASVASRGAMILFLSIEVFDQSISRWLFELEARDGLFTSKKILDMLAVKWHGAIDSIKKEGLNMSGSFISIKFLLDSSSEEFLSSCFALLLDRSVDDSAQQSFGIMDLSNRQTKLDVINAIMDSEEYQSRDRPLAIHPEQERLADIHFRMKQSSLFYRRQIVPPNFFAVGPAGEEVCQSRGICSIIEYVDPGRWIMRQTLNLLGQTSEGSSLNAQPGWVFFGGKFRLSSGRFCLDLKFACEDNHDLIIDIVSKSGSYCHLKAIFTREVLSSLRFDLDHDLDGLEVRLFNNGPSDTKINLGYVKLRRI